MFCREHKQSRAIPPSQMISLDDATFACSSYKSGHHIQQFLSPVLSTNNQSRCTFWQSESGTLPHTIHCRFPFIKIISGVRVFVDTAQDESYTPQFVVIEAGSYIADLLRVTTVELKGFQQGWFHIDFKEPVYASCISIVIMGNFQNGRDSRLRGIQLV